MNAFGMSKSAKPGVKKKEDGVFDQEQQLILRLPPGPAMALHHELDQGCMNLKDKLFIDMQPDMRHCRVTFGGQILSAKVMDLPCVVECLKTTDQKTFYKTSDISQMLVCSVEDDDSGDETTSPTKRRTEKDKKYNWNHGITPPLKNVRKRRFRKTLKKKYPEQPDIEKEVKRLLRMDSEAIDVRWEVVIEEQAETKQVLAQGETHILDDEVDEKMTASTTNLLELAEHEIFGDVSSSEDEEDEKEVNIMDSGGEEEVNYPPTEGKDETVDYTGDMAPDEPEEGEELD